MTYCLCRKCRTTNLILQCSKLIFEHSNNYKRKRGKKMLELEHRLNKLKEEKGLTAKELAEASGVPLPTVNRILSGQTPDPCYSTVCRLLDVLGASNDDKKTFEESSNVEHYKSMIALYERGLAQRNKWIKLLAGIFIGIVAVIVIVLVVDVLNPNMGFVRY
nr:MAG TPA: helix-turn-helix domain protein [Caudoviricetes sp.]